jgi:HSP20 family protein
MAEKKEAKEKEEARGLAPWRPFGDWPSLWEGFPARSRLIDELFREWPKAQRAGSFLPAVDLAESDSQYTLTVELPGAKKDDVHVELREGMLVIHGEKKSEREEKRERGRYIERSYGSFSRSFSLPPDAHAERLGASFKDGILTITIPRTEAAKPKQIAIKD